MKYRPIRIAVLTAGERTRVARGAGHLIVTDFAIREFVADAPVGVPLMTDHSGAVEHRGGHVAKWAVEQVDNATVLVAYARVTDLSIDLAVGQPVSLGMTFPTEATRTDDRDGYRRVNKFSCKELSILTAGDPGAMKSARILEVGDVVGEDTKTTAAADTPFMTRWKAAGLTVGHSTVPADVISVT